MPRKKKTQPVYQPYPKPDAVRSGAKVSWNYYRSPADAVKAAEAARYNAKIKEQQGYDFGYCTPGTTKVMPADTKLDTGVRIGGMVEVCLP